MSKADRDVGRPANWPDAAIRWREIGVADVNWHALVPHNSIAWKISRRCKPPGKYMPKSETDRSWNGLTLGDVCDLGVREWGLYPAWGPKTTELFKSALRIIARDPAAATDYRTKDAFDPEVD